MTSYTYLPLQGSSDIRILYIYSAVDDTDPLSANLVHVNLDDRPLYAALSYTWGSSELCSRITLDGGGDLAITANLDQALRRVRPRTRPGMPPGTPSRIWADGICINQTDVIERNQQVGLMRRIYSQCLSGFIYIGDEADGSDEIPGFLRRLVPGIQSDKGNVEHWHENPLLPDENDLGWKALRSLFERPWFLRVWVIQEFALPRRIRMICGEWELQGDIVSQMTLVPTLNRSRQAMGGLDTVEGSDFARAWTHQELLLRCRHSAGHSLVYQNFDALRGHVVGLMELLWSCRQCKATDPRDHYFALLGLSPDAALEPTLAADYSKAIEDVSMDYGRYFINAGLGLPILYMSNDAEAPDETRPSWLPNFTGLPPLGDKIWWLHEGKEHGVSISVGGADLRSLLVSGSLLDTVAVLGGEKGLQGLPPRYWRDDWIEEIDSLVAGVESYPSGLDIDEAVCRTIIADTSLEKEKPAPGHYYQLYRLCRKVKNRTFSVQSLTSEVIATLGEMLEEAKLFDMAVAMLATSRFCVTKDGFFGMVPRATRPGDMIFTIQGDEQSATFVVRKNAARDSYQWLGHAYVHDIWTVREYEKLAWEVITVD